MEYRQIGKSGLKVSEIGLGCASATFVGKADEETSVNIIHHALDLGVNFIDTAETYAEGRSEILVGKAVKEKRSQVIIATKFGQTRSVGPSEQPGSRSNVLKAVEGSLKRLTTDYIDLYMLHRPDPNTPIEETLRALDDLVRVGKVRYIGSSNFAAWQVCEAAWVSRTHNLESFICSESEYNLLDRNIERELIPCCQALDIGIIPDFPLAKGFLTGKYQRDQEMPRDARFTSMPQFADAKYKDLRRYDNMLSDTNFDKLTKLETFAEERGHRVGELAIAWLLFYPWLSSVIPGATSAEQVKLNVAATSWKLTTEDIDLLDEIV
ncbi:aldo/keto reductase [Chloroflexota bacterium]